MLRTRCAALLRNDSICGAEAELRFNERLSLCREHYEEIEQSAVDKRRHRVAEANIRMEKMQRVAERLAKQKGSVTTTGRTWRYSFQDFDKSTDEWVRVSKGGFRTEKEAKAALRIALQTARDATHLGKKAAVSKAVAAREESITGTWAAADAAKAAAVAGALADRTARARARRESERGRLVYYVQRTDMAIKIGTTWNMRDRLATFRNATPVVLLAVHTGGQPAEAALHRKFASERLDGEWFTPSPRLLEHIAAVNAVRPPKQESLGERVRLLDVAA